MIKWGQTKKLHADRLKVPLLALDFYVKQKENTHANKKTNKENENEQREIQN